MKNQAISGEDFWHGEKRSFKPIGQEGVSFLALYLTEGRITRANMR